MPSKLVINCVWSIIVSYYLFLDLYMIQKKIPRSLLELYTFKIT